jgi:hypothetical protein
LSRRRRRAALAAVVWAVGATAACRQDMHDQPKLEPLEASTFFADGRASRAPVAGTVARGQLREDPLRYRGLDPDGSFARTIPIPVDAALLRRGRERFDIFCSPCHDRAGSGRGMIVRRGFKQPSSFHVERLRAERPGYFFDVITNGFGQMSSYAGQVPVDDRWAIAAYIRALQLSQYAPPELLADLDRAALVSAPAVAGPDGGEGGAAPTAPAVADPGSPEAGTPSPAAGGADHPPTTPADRTPPGGGAPRR